LLQSWDSVVELPRGSRSFTDTRLP